MARLAAVMMGNMLGRRQFFENDSDDSDLTSDDNYYFWYTREGYIVKWCLFIAFCLCLTTYFVLGRRLAKRRIRANQKPFWSTGWLLSRAERGLPPPGNWPAPYGPAGHYGGQPHGQEGYYGMQNMPPPPPVYDADRPPMYEGPAAGGSSGVQQGNGVGGGTSKVNPNQDEFAPPYAPPPGPPPPPGAGR